MIKANTNNNQCDVTCDGSLSECAEDLMGMVETVIDMLADEDDDAQGLASCVVTMLINRFEINVDKCKMVASMIDEVCDGGN